jgi:hypothetical protein
MELTWAIPDTTPPAFPIENQGISMQLAQRWYQEDSTFPENPCGGSGVLRLGTCLPSPSSRPSRDTPSPEIFIERDEVGR